MAWQYRVTKLSVGSANGVHPSQIGDTTPTQWLARQKNGDASPAWFLIPNQKVRSSNLLGRTRASPALGRGSFVLAGRRAARADAPGVVR